MSILITHIDAHVAGGESAFGAVAALGTTDDYATVVIGSDGSSEIVSASEGDSLRVRLLELARQRVIDNGQCLAVVGPDTASRLRAISFGMPPEMRELLLPVVETAQVEHGLRVFSTHSAKLKTIRWAVESHALQSFDDEARRWPDVRPPLLYLYWGVLERSTELDHFEALTRGGWLYRDVVRDDTMYRRLSLDAVAFADAQSDYEFEFAINDYRQTVERPTSQAKLEDIGLGTVRDDIQRDQLLTQMDHRLARLEEVSQAQPVRVELTSVMFQHVYQPRTELVWRRRSGPVPLVSPTNSAQLDPSLQSGLKAQIERLVRFSTLKDVNRELE